jgi:hypothetical protein
MSLFPSVDFAQVRKNDKSLAERNLWQGGVNHPESSQEIYSPALARACGMARISLSFSVRPSTVTTSSGPNFRASFFVRFEPTPRRERPTAKRTSKQPP